MLLFPGIAKNSEDQEGHHFILRNSLEFSARVYFQKKSQKSERISRKLSGMFLRSSREIPRFSWEISLSRYRNSVISLRHVWEINGYWGLRTMNRLFWCLLITKLNKVDLRLMYFCVIWREIIDFNGRLSPPPPPISQASRYYVTSNRWDVVWEVEYWVLQTINIVIFCLLINKVSKEDWFPMYFCVFWVWIHWCSQLFGSINPRTYKGGRVGVYATPPQKVFLSFEFFSTR